MSTVTNMEDAALEAHQVACALECLHDNSAPAGVRMPPTASSSEPRNAFSRDLYALAERQKKEAPAMSTEIAMPTPQEPTLKVEPIARVDRVMGVLHLARRMTVYGMEKHGTVHDWGHMDCSLWLAIDELEQLRNDLEGLGHV